MRTRCGIGCESRGLILAEQRKPVVKVLTIKGERSENDVLTDDDFELVAELQGEAWKAERLAQKAVDRIESRILHGARIEARRYYFDQDLRMVRSVKETRPRKRGAASGE